MRMSGRVRVGWGMRMGVRVRVRMPALRFVSVYVRKMSKDTYMMVVSPHPHALDGFEDDKYGY